MGLLLKFCDRANFDEMDVNSKKRTFSPFLKVLEILVKQMFCYFLHSFKVEDACWNSIRFVSPLSSFRTTVSRSGRPGRPRFG